MKLKIPIFLLLITMGLTSCSKKTTTLWVSGAKTPCSAGAGKMECLNVYKGNNLNDAEWQNFSSQIKGFDFEEGYYQKIEVEEKKLKASEVPADGSSIEYVLKKVIQKDEDDRLKLNGDWYAVELGGAKISKKYKAPTMTIDFEGKRVSGNDGCNNFSSSLGNVTVSRISFGNAAVTKKMCPDMTVANQFDQVFSNIQLYEIENDKLMFFDGNKKPLATFIPGLPAVETTQTNMERLSNSWTAVKINGHIVPKSIVAPTIMLDVASNQFSGNDGCNDFGGNFAQVDDATLNFGTLALTQKMCNDMLPGEEFNEAIASTASYNFDDDKLQFFNENGDEVAVFIPGPTK